MAEPMNLSWVLDSLEQVNDRGISVLYTLLYHHPDINPILFTAVEKEMMRRLRS